MNSFNIVGNKTQISDDVLHDYMVMALNNAFGKYNDDFDFCVLFKEITLTHKRDKKK